MMPPERVAYQDWVELGIFFVVAILVVGCIFVITAPVPVETTTVTTETQNITVAPTVTRAPIPTAAPVLTTYTEDQFYPGLRLMGQLYTWKRLNVSGEKDMEVSTLVYGGKLLPLYHWRSEQWQEYFLEFPQRGSQFLIVMVAQWMNGTTQQDDPSMWGFDLEHFGVSYAGKVYQPDVGYSPNLRIRELENLSDLGDVDRLKPYGFDVVYSAERNASVNAGWMAIPKSWLRMGFSNRWDGYIIFQVPSDAEIGDLVVVSDFGEFGDAAWSYRNLNT